MTNEGKDKSTVEPDSTEDIFPVLFGYIPTWEDTAFLLNFMNPVLPDGEVLTTFVDCGSAGHQMHTRVIDADDYMDHMLIIVTETDVDTISEAEIERPVSAKSYTVGTYNTDTAELCDHFTVTGDTAFIASERLAGGWHKLVRYVYDLDGKESQTVGSEYDPHLNGRDAINHYRALAKLGS